MEKENDILERSVILIQLYSNYTMTSLATPNQVENYLSPSAKSVIPSTIKRKLLDTINKEPNCKLILSYTLKAHNINNTLKDN